MLNRAIGGAFGTLTDIGGYFDIGPFAPTSKELFIRWAQWATLSPFFRVHGSILNGAHMPWSYDAQTLAEYKRLAALHRRAQPLILRLWRTAKATGVPVTRPQWLADPGDPTGAREDQSWLLGRDVLVAPIVIEGARSRRVRFPAGCWERGDGSTAGRRYAGRRTAFVSAPLLELPWFVRCGTRPLAGGGGGGGTGGGSGPPPPPAPPPGFTGAAQRDAAS